MNFSVTILGNNSALPAHDRHPTSQVVNLHNELLLIDCGEGTQMQMQRYKIKRSRIKHIFISHMHGDHYFGLPGLITSYQLNQRKDSLHIYAPAPLKNIIQQILDSSNSVLNFEVIWHDLHFEKTEMILETESFTVHSFPVYHRIPTSGFLITEKPGLRKIRSEKIEEFQIPNESILAIKQGKDFVLDNGKVVSNNELTVEASAIRKYAFCADTIFDERICNSIEFADLIYHESTFMADSAERAMQTYHCTATQAATIALKANGKKLLLGHFSAKYANLNPLLAEAKTVFKNSELAIEGNTYLV